MQNGRTLPRLHLAGRGPARCAVAALLLPILGLLTADPAPAFEAGVLARIDSLRSAFLADSALAAIDQALRAAESSADSALFLALWVRQGELLTALGQARAGERVLRRALASAWSQGDSATACAALRWLSVATTSQGRTEEATELYRELLGLSRRLGNRLNEGWALVGLGWGATTRGRGEEGVQHCRAAVDLFRAIADRRAEAWARNGLGIALEHAGRLDEARRSYLAAAELAREAQYSLVASFAANNLGSLEYSRGDPGKALEYFREAARLQRSRGNIRESIIPGINIALCETELGRFDAASDSLEKMLALCRREGFEDLEAKVLNQLGDTRGYQGRRDEARAFYRAVLRLGDRAPLKNRTESVFGLVRSLDDPDSCQAMVVLIDEALAALGPRGDPELRTRLDLGLGYMYTKGGRAADAIGPLRRVEQATARLGLTTIAPEALGVLGRAYLALGQRDSARVAFQRAARLWANRRGLPADPEWREARGAWSRSICSNLIGLTLGDRPGPEQIREAYECAQGFKACTLLERMSGPAVERDDLDPAVSLAHLQTVLLDGELLLDFFLGPEQSYLFAVTRDSCRAAALPSEEALESAARLYHDLVAAPPTRAADEAAVREAGLRLGTRLLSGIGDWARTHQRILVAPDGALNLLPLEELLPDMPADAEWARVPSAAVLERIRSARDPSPGCAAPPAIPAGARTTSQPVVRTLVLADDAGPAGRLRGIDEEVSDLAHRYEGMELRVLTGTDSLRVEDLAGPWSIYHVASHAVVDDQRPWRSALHLGEGGLQAGTIARAHLPARLACLSSCRTSHGRVLSGEGMLGLSTALLSAGTGCVVATLWPVEDRATARLMRAFYAELSAGRSVAGALGRAKRQLREDPATSHPFFWAGFVAIGAGDTRIRLVPRRQAPAAAAGIAASVVLPALGLAIWMRRRQMRKHVIRDPNEHLKG